MLLVLSANVTSST